MLDVRTVPRGCVYITAVECGSGNAAIPDRNILKEYAAVFEDLDLDALLNNGTFDVILPLYMTRGVYEYFGHEVSRKFTLHFPGETYVNNQFVPVAAETSTDYMETLAPSGVYTQSTCVQAAKTRPFPLGALRTKYKNDPNRPFQVAYDILSSFYSSHTVVPRSDKPLYDAIVQSVRAYDLAYAFATTHSADLDKDVWIQSLSKTIVQTAKRVTIADMMATYPGVHLNALCRSVGPSCKQQSLVRRPLSPHLRDRVMDRGGSPSL